MGLLRGLPKGIFRGEERYGAQVDMCHFGLVGSGNPNPSNFRATHMAAVCVWGLSRGVSFGWRVVAC